ncbi:UNVERIFIED_CONTAM: hypothetical protein GTU68_012430 [Idotea baltica]|nr:hypothetical protein [Idotea baltica]
MTWDIRGKRVVLTGGNSGIGLTTCLDLCRRGALVTLTVRDRAKGEEAVRVIREAVPGADVSWALLDLAETHSIDAFADELLEAGHPLHVLIHNAGVILSERRMNSVGIEMTFMVNHLGPFLLQQRLEPLLRESAPARVIVVASAAHRRAARGLDFDDLQFERGYSAVKVYSAAKFANILFTKELARRLEGTGVTANCLHPGVVRTRFARDGDASGPWGFAFNYLGFLFLSPEKGARTTIHLATADPLPVPTGGYYSRSQPAKPCAAALDSEEARQLWLESERMLADLH